MGALFYLELRIKAVRNVIDNSIATTSPIIEETVPSALLEIDSEMKIKEEIQSFINYQTNTTFLRNSQLNMDLNIPKFISDGEKNLELVDRSRQWCRDLFNIFQREEATVPFRRAIAECSFELSIEDRGRRCYNEHSAAYQLAVIFYQLRSTTDYRTGGRQGGKRQRIMQIYPRFLRRAKDVVQDSGAK
jgi:hypothetical protein